jgi:basic amino acid/polyamine antiporter, APA family
VSLAPPADAWPRTRILFAMSRDGMIPQVSSRMDPRSFTPVPGTIVAAVAVSRRATPGW